jgi:uncharacterized protein
MIPRLIACFFIAASSFTSAVHAQGAAAPAAVVPQISAVGIGELRVPPDRAMLTFTVETSGVDAARAGRENAARMAGLRQALEKHGIPAAAISTVGYSVRNEARFQGRGPKGEPNWFVARNGVRVEVARLDQVGSIIDAGLAAGANHVDDVVFLATEERELRRKALSVAVQHAREQAETMAAAAGGKLGELIEVGAVDGPVYPGLAMARASPETVVSRTEITITERVVARWRFVSG